MSVNTERIGGCAEGAEFEKRMRGGWKVQSSVEGERRVDEFAVEGWEGGVSSLGKEAQRFCVSIYLASQSMEMEANGAILSCAVRGGGGNGGKSYP